MCASFSDWQQFLLESEKIIELNECLHYEFESIRKKVIEMFKSFPEDKHEFILQNGLFDVILRVLGDSKTPKRETLITDFLMKLKGVFTVYFSFLDTFKLRVNH
jgi:hypothetical protein